MWSDLLGVQPEAPLTQVVCNLDFQSSKINFLKFEIAAFGLHAHTHLCNEINNPACMLKLFLGNDEPISYDVRLIGVAVSLLKKTPEKRRIGLL